MTTGMSPDLRPRAAARSGTERAVIDALLEHHRQTLRWKCSNLTPEQLATPSAGPSKLTLVGLVRHLAEVERWWFRDVLLGADLGPIYCTDQYPDADFEHVAPASVAADLQRWEDEVAAAKAAWNSADLDAQVSHPLRPAERIDARWIALHMVEEYARHNGHADLIRERIDGAVGS